MTRHFNYQHWRLAGGYDLEIGHFRGGLHGGELVDSGFFAQWRQFRFLFQQVAAGGTIAHTFGCYSGFGELRYTELMLNIILQNP